ncbi:hypothetical protein KM043_005954 [Ampulex compressa]|nr:hypothetical protein KM043_005954 [Ampulex compressa]
MRRGGGQRDGRKKMNIRAPKGDKRREEGGWMRLRRMDQGDYGTTLRIARRWPEFLASGDLLKPNGEPREIVVRRQHAARIFFFTSSGREGA